MNERDLNETGEFSIFSEKKRLEGKAVNCRVVSMVEGSPLTAWILFSSRTRGINNFGHSKQLLYQTAVLGPTRINSEFHLNWCSRLSSKGLKE